MRKFKLFLLILLIIIGSLYAVFLFVLPPVLSSNAFKKKVDKLVYEKTGIKITSEYLNVKTYPNLVIEVEADKLKLDSNETELLDAQNTVLKYDIKRLSPEIIDIDYIYINDRGFKNIVKKNDKKKKFKLKLKKVPQINLKKAEIWVDKGDISSVFVTVENLNVSEKQNKQIYINFQAEIVSDLLRNLVNIGKEGCLYIDNNALYADNLQVIIGVSSLNINGKITDNKNNTDFSLKGKDIPVSDIMASLLYFQKLKEPGKKFIENFYDYSGTMNVDVQVKNNGIYGKCTADDLAANTVLFNVPVHFPVADFIFNEKTMKAEANGTLGQEKVYTSVDMINIATSDQEVNGYVHSNLTNKTVSKYIPDTSLNGVADASVKYNIKNRIINVDYLLKLAKGSDIYYKTAYLGLEDKDRRLLVRTRKEKDTLEITNYDYSTTENGEISKIIMGNGLFLKENGHFNPQYLTFKTQKDAPVSVTGSFYKYVHGGFFNGDLKYDFKHNKITGNFDIKDSQYKAFKLKNAKVIANDNTVEIEAEGTYRNSPFECKINGLNNFEKQIKIYDMYLFLEEYIVRHKPPNAKMPTKLDTKKIRDTVRKINVDVDKWTIKLNKLKRNRLELSNINVTGSIHDEIFNFIVPSLNFAKGTLSANGSYNYEDRTSDVMLTAKNIDSAMAADVLFELPGQIMGIANATLKAKTKRGLEDVNADITFSVKDGFLPKLGSTEFMIKKSRMVKRPFKVKLSDVVNIDLKDMEALKSDVEGIFTLDNQKIKNAKITSAQHYLALLIEGDYDTETQIADFEIFGKYNRDKLSKVKIFYVPVTWIFKVFFKNEKTADTYKNKLNEIPDIEGDIDDEYAFRVKLDGNINTNDVKVELKSIK